MNVGDALTLLCAVLYALQIVLYARYSKGRDPLVLTGMQFVGVGAINLAIACLTETPPTWGVLDPSDWASLSYLIVMCTVVAIVLQGVGQKHIPAPTAALLLSLESVFGAGFSVALGAEELTVRIAVGFAVVFGAILVSELGGGREGPSDEAGGGRKGRPEA